jgi:hypothetical protein
VKLPNAEHAIVDIVKLRDYAQNTSHARGRHKARVFLAALDLTAVDAEELRTALLKSARTGDAVRGASDEFGTPLHHRFRNGPLNQTDARARLLDHPGE